MSFRERESFWLVGPPILRLAGACSAGLHRGERYPAHLHVGRQVCYPALSPSNQSLFWRVVSVVVIGLVLALEVAKFVGAVSARF